jgi:hypothetical protein
MPSPSTERDRPSARAPLAASLKVAFLASALLAAWAAPLFSVSVSPMGIYMDHRSRTGTLTLYNPGTRTEEIEIGFAFGYPQADAEGNVTVPLVEEAPAGEPSAVPWLSAFPRRVVFEPGQRQVVRLLARPPADLAEGEYWARALVRSRGGQAPIESRTGDVGIQIDVETVVVVAVNYRNGTVRTGVEVRSADVRLAADSLFVAFEVARTGNAAFLGRAVVEALDERGRVVASSEDVVAVYHSMLRRFPLSLPAGVPAPVSVRITLDTRRDDLPPGGALPARPVVHQVAIH